MERPILRSSKLELMAMPKEILEHIFIHLEGRDLLTASHVCKIFAAIAEIAFGRRYSKQFWFVWVSDDNKYHYEYHKIMLSKYGKKLSSILISDVPDARDWILDVIEQNCCNLKSITLSRVPKIINLKGLKDVSLFRVRNMSKEHLNRLIDNNGQLESLTFTNDRSIELLEMLHNRLPMLKILRIYSENANDDFMLNIPRITLPSLQVLQLSLATDNDTYVRILKALDCDRLGVLDMGAAYEADDEFIGQTYRFKMLTSLELKDLFITMEQLKALTKHLPHLAKFAMPITESESNADTQTKIFSVLSVFPRLRKLTICLPDFKRFNHDLRNQSIYEFHERFAKRFANVELKISYLGDVVSTSKDRIYLYETESNTLEVHWMDNFNQHNIRNTLRKISNWHQVYNLKFINNCFDNFDISILSLKTNYINCLEIKSKGPISVNAFVSIIKAFLLTFDCNLISNKWLYFILIGFTAMFFVLSKS